ncbi:MAG: polymer-forming cytoskeletal protein [Longimicrobiales bacterium]|nr:polymer-forming cytoskeletal protein [Longimicrobiales bacterium]
MFIKTITAYTLIFISSITPSLQGQERSQRETQTTDPHSNHVVDVHVDDGSKQIKVSFGESGLLSWISLKSLAAFGLLDTHEHLNFLEDDCLDAHIGEDLIIGEEAEINCNILMIGGDLTVKGTVSGDVIIIDGDLSIEGDGRVSGEIVGRHTGTHNSGEDIVGLDSSSPDQEGTDQKIVRKELRKEIRHALKIPSSIGFTSTNELSLGWGGGVITVLAVFSQILALLLLGLVGSLLLKLRASYVQDLSTTLEDNTGKTILVGLLVTVLTLPVFLLGIVVLAISIVGIPLILLWIITLPAALSLAWILGILLVSKWLGTKILSRESGPFHNRLSPRNLYHTVPTGLVGLQAPLLLASLISIVPGTGALTVLLVVIGTILHSLTPLVGMGAVFLVFKQRQL